MGIPKHFPCPECGNDGSDVDELEWQVKELGEQLAKANERVSELEQWIAGIADSHNAIPDWIQHSARCMLTKEQENG